MLAFFHRGSLSAAEASGAGTSDPAGAVSGAWLASILRALARLGHTVHAVCPEREPAALDFIAEAYAYEPDGSVSTLLHRETVFRGRIVLHVPGGEKAQLPARMDDLFQVAAAVVPGHAPTCLVAVGGGAAGAAIHRAHTAWRVPYVVIGTGEGSDPHVLQAAAAVFDIGLEASPAVNCDAARPERLPPGVDATAIHPLSWDARPARIDALLETLHLAAAERGAGGSAPLVMQTIRQLEEINWASDPVVLALAENLEAWDCLIEAVHGLGLLGPAAHVVNAHALPHGNRALWMPCADAFVQLVPQPLGVPGSPVLDAMAAGVVPLIARDVARPAERDVLSAVNPGVGRSPARPQLVLPPRAALRSEHLASALRHALAPRAQGARTLPARLRHAVLERYDWNRVAGTLLERLRALAPIESTPAP